MSNRDNPPTELERLYAANAGVYVLTLAMIILMAYEVHQHHSWAIIPVTLIGLSFAWYAIALRWRAYRKTQR